MGGFPGGFFQDHEAYRNPAAERILDEEEHGHHEDHAHGPGCGHEAVGHGDHTDYVHDGHRHFFRDGKWFHHKTEDD